MEKAELITDVKYICVRSEKAAHEFFKLSDIDIISKDIIK